MTLGELFEKHGSVWLAVDGVKRFKPLAYSEVRPKIIVGEMYDGTTYSFLESQSDFSLYHEPKKLKRLELLGWVHISNGAFAYADIDPGGSWIPALDANGNKLKLEIFVEE